MPKKKRVIYPKVLPCPRCQHNMHVFVDTATNRHAAQCCLCTLKIDLRDYQSLIKQ